MNTFDIQSKVSKADATQEKIDDWTYNEAYKLITE